MSNTGHKARDGKESTLVGLLLFTGVAAIAGGLLLAVRPDGSLLQAKPSALRGTPFPDWRVPGILLASLVGGGAVGSAWWLMGRGWRSRELALLYALGLLAFEIVELVTIGFQPLEAVFALVALAIAGLALSSKTVGERLARAGQTTAPQQKPMSHQAKA